MSELRADAGLISEVRMSSKTQGWWVWGGGAQGWVTSPDSSGTAGGGSAPVKKNKKIWGLPTNAKEDDGGAPLPKPPNGEMGDFVPDGALHQASTPLPSKLPQAGGEEAILAGGKVCCSLTTARQILPRGPSRMETPDPSASFQCPTDLI